MKARRSSQHNLKRKIRKIEDCDKDMLDRLFISIIYTGNPAHKKKPGDFGLTPPSDPRPGKALCDIAKIFNRADALKLLKNGAKRGMISMQDINGFPQNIWAVDENGYVHESQLENRETGVYHGYPLPESDPMRSVIIQEWEARQDEN